MYATVTLRLQILKLIEQMRFPLPGSKLYVSNQKIHILKKKQKIALFCQPIILSKKKAKNRIVLSTDNQMKSFFRFHLVPRFS